MINLIVYEFISTIMIHVNFEHSQSHHTCSSYQYSFLVNKTDLKLDKHKPVNLHTLLLCILLQFLMLNLMMYIVVDTHTKFKSIIKISLWFPIT